MFIQQLSELQSRIPKMGCAVVPTSFDPADPKLGVFPRPLEWEWHSCREMLERYKSKGVVVRTPLFWQVISPIHRACKAVGCGLFMNDVGNMPIGEASVRLAGIDTIITDTRDAFAFSLFLSERNTRIPSWLIVHEPTRDWTLPIPLQEPSVAVTQEVHLFPGFPLLIQCAHLSTAKTASFHTSSECRITLDGECSVVSSKGEHPTPFENYAVALALESCGTCECGEEILRRRT